MMKSPAGLVTITLSVATLLAGTFLLVSGTRGQNTSFQSSTGQLDVQTFASGLANPWGLAFLGDGRLLVTERAGRMRIVSAEGQLSPPLKNVPDVWASGQGGLLDVITDKSFTQNRIIFFCYAERTSGGGRTAVARAKLNDGAGRLDETKVIFRQEGRCRRAITMAAASRKPPTAICSSPSAITTARATRRRALPITSAR